MNDELRETLVWLLIIQRKPLVEPLDKCSPLIDENNELISIFVTSIATAQKTWKSNNGSTLPSFVSFLPSSFITPCSIFDIQFLRREIA